MGSALGLPQACGHNDFPDEVKKNEVPWQTIINKLSYVDSEKSFRKYSLAEITKLKENALALRLELQTIFDDLALGNDNFQKSLEVMKVMSMVHELVKESSELICKKISNTFLNIFSSNLIRILS